MDIQSPKGTRDILPDEINRWRWIENTAREVFERFDYQEIRTPIFEHTEIFTRSIGEATDIVEKEMYTFKDKAGRSISLRPEGTASVVRACIQNGMLGNVPILKLYYLGQMFRYERPQSGRYREFWQAGVEAFGIAEPAIDAEIVMMSDHFLKELGLSEVTLHLNSMGCNECRPKYVEKFKDFIAGHLDELCGQCVSRYDRNPLRILDCKNPECQKVLQDAPLISDYLCESCKEHFTTVKSYLDELNVDYIEDPFIVRGLDYYSRTTFEFIAEGLGAQDTVLGGGRYDYLVEDFGGKPTPACGFAMGVDRMALVLEAQEAEIPEVFPLEVYIAVIGERALPAAVKMVADLRRNGVSAEMEYAGRSLGTQMKTADKINAQNVIFLGEDELSSGVVAIRNMKHGEQEDVPIDEVVDFFMSLDE